jgi:hypothetical protein
MSNKKRRIAICGHLCHNGNVKDAKIHVRLPAALKQKIATIAEGRGEAESVILREGR